LSGRFPVGLLKGPDQAIAFFTALWEAFPDIKMTITRIVADNSAVSVQARAEGTHQGAFHTPGGDIPPTGRRVDFPFSEHYEVTRNLIVSAQLIFDRLEFLEQLGVAPSPASV
jgi:predicted ester cyclase